MKKFAAFLLSSLLLAQYDYSLVDINPTSDTYEDSVGTSYFEETITLHYFGYFTWGTCTARFEQLNELYNNIVSEGLPIRLIGVGKSSYISGLSNWTNGNNSAVCSDESPFQVWSDWSANQRDLFMLDIDGNLILHQNVTSGLPDDLEDLIHSTLHSTEYSDKNPKSFSITQNYPNPFNPRTVIRYNVPITSQVNITIYNVKGEIITNLVNQYQMAGSRFVNWNATNSTGQTVPAGVYLYKIVPGDFTQTKKMMLLK